MGSLTDRAAPRITTRRFDRSGRMRQDTPYLGMSTMGKLDTHDSMGLRSPDKRCSNVDVFTWVQRPAPGRAVEVSRVLHDRTLPCAILSSESDYPHACPLRWCRRDDGAIDQAIGRPGVCGRVPRARRVQLWQQVGSRGSGARVRVRHRHQSELQSPAPAVGRRRGLAQGPYRALRRERGRVHVPPVHRIRRPTGVRCGATRTPQGHPDALASAEGTAFEGYRYSSRHCRGWFSKTGARTSHT